MTSSVSSGQIGPTYCVAPGQIRSGCMPNNEKETNSFVADLLTMPANIYNITVDYELLQSLTSTLTRKRQTTTFVNRINN